MTKEIVLGSGCFWCTEAVFNNISGVVKTEVGYAGGASDNPNYETVCSGSTGHVEVTKISYDPKIIGAEKILGLFWKCHDSTTLNRQGNDVGTQYRSIILYTDQQQKIVAEKLKPKSAVTQIKPLVKFFLAEEYHQNYFAKNPESGYCQAIIIPKLKHMSETGDNGHAK